ncbi:MAG: hypothetical protein HOP16_20225 [Acidobacteria bacterium]|nr:hypothetical protein [Acidobacteriota bacterium]
MASKVVGRKGGVSRLILEQELQRLETVYRLRADEFETRVLALSRFAPDRVANVLQQHCRVRHYPSLAYELLAHLLKHGFVDAIVNYNFDELLDEAIDEELGPGGSARILTEGDCARELTRSSRTHDRTRPLYIKPHGTASAPDTLRFTREDYFSLPSDIIRLLGVLIEGRPLDDIHFRRTTAATPVCVLAIGHALQSPELLRLFRSVHSGSKLFSVTSDPLREDDWPDAMRRIASGRWTKVSSAFARRGHRVESGLDRFLRSTWRESVRCTARNSRTRPWLSARGIERHEVVARLFAITRFGILKRREGDPKLRDYLHDRAIVELALAIAKSKGFVDLRELERGRPGRMFRLHEDHAHHRRESLVDAIESLGMDRRDAAANAFWHQRAPKDESGDFGRLTLTDEQGRAMCHDLAKSCYRLLSKNRRAKMRSGGRRVLNEALWAMFRGDEVEVGAESPDRLWSRFRSPTPLTTLAQMRRFTQELLRRRWDLLLCVAESGEWLLEDWAARAIRTTRGPSKRGAVALVVADRKKQDEIEARFGPISIGMLPWQLHNRHMTIAVSRQGERWVPTAALFYERRYRSATVYPIRLSLRSDCESVLNDFVVYFEKARRHAEGRSEVVRLSKREMHGTRQRILAEIASQ